jgi:glycosyltransferase involved in cell wall biosynthesis
MTRIAFNLSFIDSSPLTGPGYYAVQLFEHILRDFKVPNSKCELIAYVQASAVEHFSPDAQTFIRKIPSLNGRFSRVLYEQFFLPIVCIREGIDLLFSPAFVSPVWGAKRLVATICDMYYRVVPEATEPFQRKYWNFMIPITGYVCDHIITISANSKKDIETYIPVARGKTVSIPLASRFEVPDTGKEPEVLAHRPAILMVANLTPNKNCAVVVEAVSILRKKGRDVSFVHAGKDHLGLLQKSIEENDAGSF